MITIIAVGKKHEDWIQPGIERYQQRLRQPFNVDWVLLPHSSLQGDLARQEESGRIFSRLGANEYVVLLDETGQMIDSPTLASLLNTQFAHGKSTTIVIGGAFGVDTRIKERANKTLSLSRLVFPHQLVRLMAIEQVYRSQEIASGGKYHHV